MCYETIVMCICWVMEEKTLVFLEKAMTMYLIKDNIKFYISDKTHRRMINVLNSNCLVLVCWELDLKWL